MEASIGFVLHGHSLLLRTYCRNMKRDTEYVVGTPPRAKSKTVLLSTDYLIPSTLGAEGPTTSRTLAAKEKVKQYRRGAVVQ